MLTMPKRPAQLKFDPRQRQVRYLARKLAALAVVAAVAGGLMLADRFGCNRPQPDALKYDGKTFAIERVIDGDTLDVAIPDGQYPTTRIRLWGVDTPEVDNPKTGHPATYFGPQAAAFTRSLCGGRTATLRLEPGKSPRDKYGRLLAWVYLPDDKLLNRVLIEEGYGYADPRYHHHLKAELRRLQDKAMRAGRGLWKGATNDQLPYYYRDKLKRPASRPATQAARNPR